MQVVQLEVLCYLDFVISTQCLDLILRLLLEFLAVVFPVRKFSLIPKVCLKVLGIIFFLFDIELLLLLCSLNKEVSSCHLPSLLDSFL